MQSPSRFPTSSPSGSGQAGILPSLAAQTGRTEQDLFGTYLTAVGRRTGGTTERTQAWESMLIVRILRTFEALPWLVTMADSPEVEGPDVAITRLGRDLTDCEFLAR